MGIKNVFKWRVTSTKYLYLTDEENKNPFILDKKTGDRTYPLPVSGSTVTGTTVITGMTLDEGLISQTVSNIKSADSYSEKYDKMVALAPFDNDTSKLTFLEYDKYFNLDGAECVEEAVTPKCEGYEPVFNVSAYTLQNSGETEVEYTFYAERNEADKTLRYNFELGIPRGEKGEKGDDGIGCKGDKGDDGLPAIIENVEADITAIDPDEEASVDVITRVVGDNEYELDFDFRIPRGEQGEEGPSGDEGPAGWDAVVKNVTATATALIPGSTPYAIIPTSSITINENAQDKVNETSFRIDFGLPTGLQGVQGNDGRNAEIREVTASVETLEPGYWYPSEDDPNRSWIRNDAEVGVDVTPGGGGNVIDLHFWFKIPRGDKGDKGDMGGGGGGGSSRIFYDFDNVVVHTTTETVPYFTLHEEPTEIAGITFIRVWLEFFYPEDWGGGGGAACDDDCRKHRYDHYQNNSDSLSEGMVQVINGTVYPLATAQGIRSHAEGIGMELPPYSYVEVKVEGNCDDDYNITIPKNAIPVGVEFDDIVGLQLYLNSADVDICESHAPNVPAGVDPTDFYNAIKNAEMTIISATLVNSEDDHLQFSNVNVEYTISGRTYQSALGYLVDNSDLYDNRLKLNFVVNPPDAIGVATHTEGRACQAVGDYSHAEGWDTLTRGPHSHTEGLGTYTTNLSEHAEGQYNVSHSEDRTEFNNSNGCSTVSSIGIGEDDEDRKNAIEIMQNGDIYVYGIGNYDGTEVKCQDSGVQTLQDILSTSSHGTVTSIATGTGLIGGTITSSGTISHADTSSQSSVTNSGRSYIQSIGLDGMGHVTSLTSGTETVVNTDTKVTQTPTNSGDTYYSVLFSESNFDSYGNVTLTEGTRKANTIAYNPGKALLKINDLWLKNSTSSGTAIYFGDNATPNGSGAKDYTYIKEDNDDHLKIYGDRGITFESGNQTSGSADGSITLSATTYGVQVYGSITAHDNHDFVHASNEFNFAKNYSSSTENMYLNYQGPQSGSYIYNWYFCNGHDLAVSGSDPTRGTKLYAGAYYASSDERRKDVVEQISLEKAYELVEKCQTIYFTWKNDEKKKVEIGLLAQEVQKYFPEIISEDSEGYLSLDYPKLTVILLTVIRDLTRKMNNIEDRLKLLEDKLK